MHPHTPTNLTTFGLGSNLGRRAHELSRALVRLALHPRISLLRLSAVYETDAWGVEDQPAFLNMAAAARTTLTPHELLAVVKDLETALGRKETYRWGPRVVDIDILTFGDTRVDSTMLTLPHPRMAERQFVLVPLADIAPCLLLPDGRRVVEVAEVGAQELQRLGSLAEALKAEPLRT